MFKNKTIQIDLVKKDQKHNAENDELEKSFEDRTATVSDEIGKNIMRVGIAVAGYVILDTVRKVVVNATTPV